MEKDSKPQLYLEIGKLHMRIKELELENHSLKGQVNHLVDRYVKAKVG